MRARRHVATVSIPVMNESATIEQLMTQLESAVRSTDVQNQHARAVCNANYMGSIEIKIENVYKVSSNLLQKIERQWENSGINSQLMTTTVQPSTKENGSVLHLLADCTNSTTGKTLRQNRGSWVSQCLFYFFMFIFFATAYTAIADSVYSQWQHWMGQPSAPLDTANTTV